MLSISCPLGESSKRFSTYSMRTKPGEVWLADLGIAEKTRPILIVSREDIDPPRALVIQVPLTTKNRFSRYEVDLGNLRFCVRLQLPTSRVWLPFLSLAFS